MWLRIEHTTSFTYDAPIVEAYTELRLRPLSDGGQQCSSFRLTTTPPGLKVREYLDHLGNDVLHFDVLEPHDRLVVTATSEVRTAPVFVDGQRTPGPLERYDFLQPTSRTPFTDSVRAFAAEHPGGEGADRVETLGRAINESLAYDPGATDVHTTADEALALKRGVCQDFAHLLIAACRSEGLPARYVSGYLYDPAASGGNAASHAWVDVWDEERGWCSFDPTHSRPQNRALRPHRSRSRLRRRPTNQRRLPRQRPRNPGRSGPGRINLTAGDVSNAAMTRCQAPGRVPKGPVPHRRTRRSAHARVRRVSCEHSEEIAGGQERRRMHIAERRSKGAPPPLACIVRNARPLRVQHHVAARFQQVLVAVDHPAPESPPEEMVLALENPVGCLRKDAV